MIDTSIQDQISFEEKIISLIDNYLQWNGVIEPDDGICISDELLVSIKKKSDSDECAFFPIESLIRDEDGIKQADFEKVETIAQEYFFVR